ncbi:DUF3306 domain-containing protein [Shewanella sp. Scap07]|uniref:DUF3306 domain-containing protein n=1 Tax=Shewanella sp. Scap07 TaxID=2589987 RepID=UPI0015B83269|nr:DUF3306 domain-containing protein [Shewanella sp. Scap07]QLE83749.1 DUF3306 domain-containing protein [Shewanella sp. Scap07]
MSEQSSGLLSRWNLRRQKVEEEKLAEETEAANQAAAESLETQAQASELDAGEQSEEAKVVSAEELPDPEQIEVGGSFASFMAENVDPAAKAAALRALWKQPHYNEIDGLLEYALDYSNQPKLSADVSQELTKKIFRHVTKDEEETPESAEEMTADITSEADAEEAKIADTASADILDEVNEQVSQNEPEVDGGTKGTVA